MGEWGTVLPPCNSFQEMPHRLGYQTSPSQAGQHLGQRERGLCEPERPLSLRMLLADAPDARLASVMSSVYRHVNRCLQREPLNFDIPHKDANTSLQKIKPKY